MTSATASLCGALDACGATRYDVEGFRVGTDGFWEARCRPNREVYFRLFRYVADMGHHTSGSAFVFRGAQVIVNYSGCFSEHSNTGDVIVWDDGTVYVDGEDGWDERSGFDAVEAELLARFDADVVRRKEVGHVEAD